MTAFKESTKKGIALFPQLVCENMALKPEFFHIYGFLWCAPDLALSPDHMDLSLAGHCTVESSLLTGLTSLDLLDPLPPNTEYTQVH